MMSASSAAFCLSFISGSATFLDAFPQHPGSFPMGSHPNARMTSSIREALSKEEHPGSTETLIGRSILGSLSMFLWRNWMTCSQSIPDLSISSLHPAQSVRIPLPIPYIEL